MALLSWVLQCTHTPPVCPTETTSSLFAKTPEHTMASALYMDMETNDNTPFCPYKDGKQACSVLPCVLSITPLLPSEPPSPGRKAGRLNCVVCAPQASLDCTSGARSRSCCPCARIVIYKWQQHVLGQSRNKRPSVLGMAFPFTASVTLLIGPMPNSTALRAQCYDQHHLLQRRDYLHELFSSRSGSKVASK